jgi:F-type H+-transporting ATPase subunit b
MADTQHSAGGTTEAGAEYHAKPAILGYDATGWVAFSMIAVILIVLWKKVPAMIAGSLDKKIAEIRGQLDAARQLREEAEQLRAKYEARLKSADAEAKDIREQAVREAEQLVAKAEHDSAELIARRQKMAEDKIAAAERSAIADVRTKAASAATQAAANIIARQHDAQADSALVDKAIAALH